MSLLLKVFEVAEGRSVPVALIGGVALAAHGIVRATKDADLLATDLRLLDATVWMPLEAESVTVSVNRGDAEDPLAGVVRKTVEARALELPRRLQKPLRKLLLAERP